jgi:hypothetical protein
MLRNTMAGTVLLRQDERIDALKSVFGELLDMDEPRKHFAAMMAGLDIRYDIDHYGGGDAHPLLGRRMPDLDVTTDDGSLRVYALLHEAQPVLLNLSAPCSIDITPWADRVWRIDASYAGMCELPALGIVDAPTAVLIRPDGYVAWVGNATNTGLREALTEWFGPPTLRAA